LVSGHANLSVGRSASKEFVSLLAEPLGTGAIDIDERNDFIHLLD